MPMVVDADTHVDETEATWEYMSEAEIQFKPATVFPESIHPVHMKGGNSRFWLIDGHLQQRRLREDPETGEVLQPTGGTTVATRELHDVPARLRHMDELGLDVQVLYSTLFIDCVTTNPDEERALTNSYNRWLAERTADSGGRLRWMIVPSLLDIDNAVDQVRFGGKHGACGVMMKGGGRIDGTPVIDPYFFPLYREASAFNLPVCFHIGRAVQDPTLVNRFSTGSNPTRSFTHLFLLGTLTLLDAFHSLVETKITEEFPDLRWGFIEASASWVPYITYELERRRKKSRGRAALPQMTEVDNILERNRLYVTCLADENLAAIAESAGTGNLVIGTDYSHPDFSFDLQVVRLLRERAEKGEVGAALVEKILSDNGRALYGL